MSQNTKTLTKNEDYKALLQDIQSLINKGKYKAYKAFDNILLQTNWQIGERIVREELENKNKTGYGKQLISNLALDLDIKWQRLYEIINFYKTYPIFHSVSGKLSRTHYRRLIELSDKKERTFYQQKAIIESWSVRELQRQIKSKLFAKTTPQEIEKTLRVKLPAIQAQEIFKDTYNFNFIGLQTSEKNFEDKIIRNIEKFLQELGGDFAFLGRQVPIKIGNQAHYIDMVLFHKGIPCTVLVDFKIGNLDSRDIGQMNKYVSYYRQNRQYPYERDAIGLIVCREADQEEVIYALSGLEEKIFVAKYKIKLPSEDKIKKIIHKLT